MNFHYDGCDDPDDVPARIFSVVGTKCPCCAFWRGMAIGGVAGIVLVLGGVFVAAVITM